jgi:hypothetical protein
LALAPALVAAEPAAPASPEAAAAPASSGGREYLVPALASHPFHVDGGARPFYHRLSFSPAYGSLGHDHLYALRFAYNPNSWLGWEASIGHNPGKSVHALLHTLDAVVRHPLPGRIQPYLRAGYGMMLVYPGESLNADPVTANLLAAGGGVELYVRNDLALRIDARSLTALGGDTHTERTVAYRYDEITFGLSFYRGLAE